MPCFQRAFGTPDGIRTHTVFILSELSLPLEYRGKIKPKPTVAGLGFEMFEVFYRSIL